MKIPKGWIESEDSIVRVFEFKDEGQAIDFIDVIDPLADAADHHPTIEIAGNKVRVTLTTHDEGNAVTEKDIALAQKINMLFKPQ